MDMYFKTDGVIKSHYLIVLKPPWTKTMISKRQNEENAAPLPRILPLQVRKVSFYFHSEREERKHGILLGWRSMTQHW